MKRIIIYILALSYILTSCGTPQTNKSARESTSKYSHSAKPSEESMKSPNDDTAEEPSDSDEQNQMALDDMFEIFFDGVRYIRIDDDTWKPPEYWIELFEESFDREYKECGSVNGISLYQKIPVGDQPGGGISTLYYFLDGVHYSLYPAGELHIFGRDLDDTELQYAEYVKETAKALESGDYEAIAYLAQLDEIKEIYADLADTSLQVQEIIYHIYRNPYGITYEAYLDVDVKSSKVLPLGSHRLIMRFDRDHRVEYPREGLALVRLSVMNSNKCPYPQTDPDNSGWTEILDLITYRINMPFESPADIPPDLLLRIVVPRAYGDTVKSGTQNPVLTPEKIAETAKLYFGLEHFNPKSPDYYDEQTGNYTLKNHSKITAHMGNSIDYLDRALNFDFSYGDNDGYRYVTIVFYKEPLNFIVERIIEYKTVIFLNEATGETSVRIISATEVASNK